MLARGAQKRCLVDPDGLDGLAQPIGLLDDRGAPRNGQTHDRPPGHPSLRSHPRHRSVALSDLLKAHARARSVRHARGAIAGCPSVHVLTGHAACTTAPDPLIPADHHRPPADRQVTHPRRASILGPGNSSTSRTSHQPSSGLHSNSNSPPASAAARMRNPSSPNNAAVTDAVASPFTWAPSRS